MSTAKSKRRFAPTIPIVSYAHQTALFLLNSASVSQGCQSKVNNPETQLFKLMLKYTREQSKANLQHKACRAEIVLGM